MVICGKVRVVTEYDPQEEAAERDESYNQPYLARRQVAESIGHLAAITSAVDRSLACLIIAVFVWAWARSALCNHMFCGIHTHVAGAVPGDLSPRPHKYTIMTSSFQREREGEEREREQEEQKWRDCVFFLVGNIPAKFRSADLRAVFSQLVEKESFVCFHYRHRPEQIQQASLADTTSSSTNSESASIACTDVHIDAPIPFPHSRTEAGGVAAKTKCCVVAMERSTSGNGGRTFAQMYANKNWSTADGGFLRQKVRITELKVSFKTSTHHNSSPTHGKTNHSIYRKSSNYSATLI